MNTDKRDTLFRLTTAAVLPILCVCLCGVLRGADLKDHPPAANSASGAAPKISTPKQLSEFVEQRLTGDRGYNPGWLVSQRDVSAIVSGLKADGWDADGLDEVYRSVLDDKHFLVRQLRSDQGRKFMEEIGKQKGGFDRLDRVSQAKGGERAITSTMTLPGGAKFWNPDGKPGFANTAQMLPTRGGRRRHAAEFAEPTGKIYTGEQLLKHLTPLLPNKPEKPGPAETATP